MLKKINTDFLFRHKSVAGVECILLPEGKMEINFCLVSVKKEALQIKMSETGVADFSLLKKQVNDAPISLVISGRGVIHKDISTSGTEDDSTIIQKVLPNANAEDFYIQKFQTSTNNSFVSVIRKELLDAVLEKIDQSGIHVINCCFGPFVIRSIKPLLPEAGSLIENFLSGKMEKAQNFSIAGEKIDSSLLIPFSAAVQYYSASHPVTAEVESINKSRREMKHKKIFQFSGIAALGFLFVVLILNTLLFFHYAKKKEELQVLYAGENSKLLRYDTLKKELLAKEKFLKRIGLQQVSRVSFFADRLAVGISPSIQLQTVNVNPIQKKMNQGKEEIAFSSKTILVAGSCKKSTELNHWLKVIKKKNWVKDVQVLNFVQNKNLGEFQLELTVN